MNDIFLVTETNHIGSATFGIFSTVAKAIKAINRVDNHTSEFTMRKYDLDSASSYVTYYIKRVNGVYVHA